MRKAFSLVELSIVLIIIGLLVAGVSSGTKLITQAKINRIIQDYANYDQAVSTFKATYDSWPGDYTEASIIWSGETNGNGDNIIAGGESLQFWRHLYLAELVSGSYTGSNSPDFNIDKQPASLRPLAHAALYNNPQYNYLGTIRTSGDSWAGVITAQKAYNIESKMDDQNPATGKIVSFHHVSGEPILDCAARTDTSVAVNHAYRTGDVKYILSADGPYCTINYVFSIDNGR